MERTKSKLVKLKFSNSTLTKDNPMDKKNSSNVLETNTAKKRGVYVERKPMNSTPDNSTPKESVKAPKRPSRGQKRFLASVLSLLSKSSTGTQYPDVEENKLKAKKTNKAENKTVITLEPEKRKKKYKSKVLNSSNYPPDTFEILQYKKNIITTPSIDFSNDEEPEDIKWAEFLPRLVQPDPEEIQMEKDKKLSHLVKEVAEGRLMKDKRVTIQADELPTLVSENKKNTTKDPGFYNFFVDLLETTFSVYNIRSEYDYHNGIPSAGSSKVAFEIDEAVAKKLQVAPEASRQPSFHSRLVEDSKKEEFVDYFQVCSQRRGKSSPPKKKMKPNYFPKYRTSKPDPRQSLLFPQSVAMRFPPLFPQTASMTQKKSFYKNNSKQMLLNMLKEQLSMDNQKLEEPESLFEALKVLAKNKRKTQKTLRFEKSPKELADNIFRTRRRSKLMSDSHKTRASSRPSDFKKRQNKSLNSEYKCSNYSIEVVNIDYDKYTRSKKDKGTIASNYSPTSYSPSFSPAETVLDSSFERSYAPMHQQVILTVKPINYCKSPHFCYERDEA